MTKKQLLASFDRHGRGNVAGYSEAGYIGSWHIECDHDIDRLLSRLLYEWIS